MFHKRMRSIPDVTPSPAPAAFFLYPLSCLPSACSSQWHWQQALYQWAFEQAKEVVRPSLPERDLLAVWN
jgi:hypothetical protein